jgi:hypothetical protein
MAFFAQIIQLFHFGWWKSGIIGPDILNIQTYFTRFGPAFIDTHRPWAG